MEKKSGGLSIIALILGIIGICISFIPILNNASFFLGILATIFSIVALVKKQNKGKAIAAIILGILSIVITLSLQSSWSKSLDKASKDLDDITGDNTTEVLKKDVEVNLGTLEIKKDEYGLIDAKMIVNVTNKSNKKASFSIQIEAVDSDNKRIDDDTVYANNLAAGQSQDFEAFTYISDDKIDAMQNATFKIAEVSKY